MVRVEGKVTAGRVWLALAITMFVVLETTSAGALFLLRRFRHIAYTPVSATALSDRHRASLEDLLAGRTTYVAYSRELGWSIKRYGTSALYRANSKGMRGAREYTAVPKDGTIRISSFGDSFTHGDDVNNEETWQRALEQLARNLEVLNLGVGGFGLDQAYLRYRHEGVVYRSHVVLIGFMSGNIERSVSVFRPFGFPATGLPLAKPRYVEENGRLVLIENPIQGLTHYRDLLADPARVLPRLGVHDYYFQTRARKGPVDFLPSVRFMKLARVVVSRRGIPRGGHYREDSEAFRVTVGVLDLFVRSVGQDGAFPVIVIFPGRRDLVLFRREGTKTYASLLKHIERKGYRYLDLLDGFGQDSEYPPDAIIPGHYSPLGNRLVAKHLYAYLMQQRLVTPPVSSRP